MATNRLCCYIVRSTLLFPNPTADGGNNLKIKEDPAWVWYIGNKYESEGKYIEGKFMTFGQYPVPQRTKDFIKKALDEEVICLVKHSQEGYIKPNSDPNQYVICWYCSDGESDLRKLARFMVDNDLIQKTQSGKLYNIAFKYDRQTYSNEYGDDFKAQIKLADFIDLNTGKTI